MVCLNWFFLEYFVANINISEKIACVLNGWAPVLLGKADLMISGYGQLAMDGAYNTLV